MSTIRSCPVCQSTPESASLFQEENIDESRLSGFSYASRKEPEYMCHRLVRCRVCDLVYASNPPGQDELANSYHVAEYDSSEEANDAAQTYINSMQPILSKVKHKNKVLEIGSGTGVLLELLKVQGFTELVGIEPSSAAIAKAPEHRRDWLRECIFDENMFEPESFDLICCFMTLEHVHDPMTIALSAWRLLRPGGVFVTVTHDYESLVNRMMGKKSPIIDIEHMQLFSRVSIYELFNRSGFIDISTSPFINRYSLGYWMRLAPLPKAAKGLLEWAIMHSGMNKLKVGLNVGNTIAAGFRGEA
ncbi:MAG: class I SAM-dependent methyltransferase [Methylococcales bacterium]|nr:class I SAM-dependent methyltransferase [Methylococcales bacterium]MDD5630960.1 class I SAM-dependent methyltransferase [Methylococcales bacterium]